MKGKRDIKKIISNIVYGVLVLGALAVSVPMKADSLWTNMPSTAFQSTSSMDGSGSAYSSNPTINEDGTADSPTASAPNRAKKGLGLPGAPDTGDDPGNVPVGDCALPLMVMAFIYLLVAYRRKTMNVKLMQNK